MNFPRVFVNLFQFNRTNWKAVALCVLAAVIFWIFNAFNKNYTTNIRFPLRFDYNQERYVPVGSLPQQISINVSGNGWDLFRKSLGVRLPDLTIPLDRPLEVRKIVGSTLPPLFINQVDGLQINYILADTLRLQIDEKDSHRFRLYPDLSKVSFREGFGRVSKISLVPDTITLEGPKSLLHQFSDSLMISVPQVSLDKSFREELEIVIPHSESLSRNPPVVTVMFEVGALEIIETNVKVSLINIPASVRSSFVDSVKMTVRIPSAQKIDFISSLVNVSAQVDLRSKSKGTQKVYPELFGVPTYAEVISLDSLTVKFY